MLVPLKPNRKQLMLNPSFQRLNDRVRVMNQTGGKQLVLTADEARNLHHDIFELLNYLNPRVKEKGEITQIEMDGGNF